MLSQTCDAEVGRIGSWHRCGRPGVVVVYRDIGDACNVYSLTYCTKHQERVDIKPASVIRQSVERLEPYKVGRLTADFPSIL